MEASYGEFLRMAREVHDPPITAKQLAENLNVSAPFITDIEKGRRLPSLEKQREIKKLLADEQFAECKFDDLAAADNDDPRIVAVDLAEMIRTTPEIRQLLRVIKLQKLSATQIQSLAESLGGTDYAVE